MSFGDDPLEQLYGTEFRYNFGNVSSKKYTYFTMAIYSNNWGLTDMYKSEYQIKVIADKVGYC